MKEYLADLIRHAGTPGQGGNLAREYLQARILASLLAGKLHAILQRPFLKGRDLYDLLWYLSDPSWPEPNLTLLNNALQQTGWAGGEVTEANWRVLIRDRLRSAAWDHAAAEVRPFLEPGVDIGLLSMENLERVLRT